MPNAAVVQSVARVPTPAAAAPDAADSAPSRVTWGQLSQLNEEYRADLYGEIEALYRGGFDIQKNASKYLHKLTGESPERYGERCAIASYQPYFGQIIDQLASDLFSQPIVVKAGADAKDTATPGDDPDDYYSGFASDCDRSGTTFAALLDKVVRSAFKMRVGIVALDAPASDGADLVNKANEEARGADAVYAYELPVESLIDWEEDGRGGFAWAIVRTSSAPRPSPFAQRDTVVETFTVWSMGDAVASWARYELRHKRDQDPKDDDSLSLVGEGSTSFRRIPILRLELPIGFWIGNKIGPQAAEHFNRRSALIGSENRSLCAIPYMARGSEFGAPGGSLPSATQQNERRGRDPVGQFHKTGWLEIGAGDTCGFMEPDGSCYELVDKQLDKVREGMFAVCHQMAASISPTSTALGRSGLSKQKDQDATEKVLLALGALVRSFATLTFRTISDARGQNVVWNAHGLDSYGSDDREQILEEAVSIDQVSIPSITFRKTHKREVARKILGAIDPVTLDQINKEIDAGVDAEEEMRGLMREAQAAGAQGLGESSQDDDRGSNGLAPKPPTTPQTPAVLGGKPATGPNVAGQTPEPGGATKDGKVGPSKNARLAGTPSEARAAPMARVAAALDKPMGPAGQPLLPDNAHHQTGQHVSAQEVYDLLKGDYREADIEWVLHVSWMGPVEVPLLSLDFSNADNWQASQPKDADHVQRFVEMIRDGKQLKPAVVVNNPSSDGKIIIVDGHHRGLASQAADVPLVAFVGQVGMDMGPWSALHDTQGGSSMQKSTAQKSSLQRS